MTCSCCGMGLHATKPPIRALIVEAGTVPETGAQTMHCGKNLLRILMAAVVVASMVVASAAFAESGCHRGECGPADTGNSNGQTANR